MSLLNNIRFFLQTAPLNVIVWKTYCKIFNVKIKLLKSWQNFVADKAGIEIGGPSGIFNSIGYMPLYPAIKKLDGINFGKETVWEGELREGSYYRYENKTGYQYIAEGTHLPQISNDSYDFVLSCNNLEHIANPMLAIFEWKRIIKNGGVIILIVPNKTCNFDHKRSYTNFDHIIADYTNKTTEEDLTHLPEILQLHDLKRDPKAGSFEEFKQRSENNFQNRCLHHHVFNIDCLKKMMEYADMKVVLQHTSKTDVFIAARKK